MRLTAILGSLLVSILVSFGLLAARDVAVSDVQSVFMTSAEAASLLASDAASGTGGRGDTELAARLRHYDIEHGAPAVVLDERGAVTLSSRPLGRLLASASRSRLAALLSGRQWPAPRTVWPSRSLLLAGQPIVSRGRVTGAVVVFAPTGGVRRRILRAWSLLALGAVVALAVLALSLCQLSRSIRQPLQALCAATLRIRAGDLEARAETGQGTVLVRRLSDSFNLMVGQLQRLVESQRDYVADASHQIRNPLNALLLRLETLCAQGPGVLTPSGATTAQAAFEDGRHLAAVLDAMLSQALAEHVHRRAAAFDVAACVLQRLQSWQCLAGPAGIAVAYTGPESAPGWHDPGAVAGALDVVLDNAIKFSSHGGQVSVEVFADDDRVLVQVTDTGPGMPPEDLELAKQRFWRGRTRADVPGSGLGLAVASTLLVQHGGSLTATRATSGGLRMEIVVPSAPVVTSTADS